MNKALRYLIVAILIRVIISAPFAQASDTYCPTLSFRRAIELTAGSEPASLVSADFNGDGAVDVAVANSGSNDISVFLSQGKEAFTAGTKYAVGGSPRAIVAGDFNSDGRIDLVTANFVTRDISVMLNAGSGRFVTAKSNSAGD